MQQGAHFAPHADNDHTTPMFDQFVGEQSRICALSNGLGPEITPFSGLFFSISICEAY